MNVFDRAVAAVAPVHAAKRAATRAALKIIDSGYGNYGANLTQEILARVGVLRWQRQGRY